MRALILICLLLLASCSREAWRIPMAPAQPDSTAHPLTFGDGKYKFNGPVSITVQQGQGNTSTSSPTDNSKAGKGRGTAATGAGSKATSEHAGTPWYIYAGILLVGAVGGFLLHRKLPRVSNLLDT